LKCARKGSGKDKIGGGKRRDRKSHQVTRWLWPPGSELSGKAGHKVLEVLISKPKGSPDLTITTTTWQQFCVICSISKIPLLKSTL
jgi:hypothetical protein